MNLKSMSKTLATAAILCAAAASFANAYVADEIEYDVSCNADGYVLTSKEPVTRMSGTEKIFLGKSCDAFHKLFGTGKWCWANGGFLAEFPEHTFGFGRQELTCEGAEAYAGNCGCQ